LNRGKMSLVYGRFKGSLIII